MGAVERTNNLSKIESERRADVEKYAAANKPSLCEPAKDLTWLLNVVSYPCYHIHVARLNCLEVHFKKARACIVAEERARVVFRKTINVPFGTCEVEAQRLWDYEKSG
jgi:hypothetical protein